MGNLEMGRFKNYSFSDVLHAEQGMFLVATAELNTNGIVYRIKTEGGNTLALFDTLEEAVKGFNELAVQI